MSSKKISRRNLLASAAQVAVAAALPLRGLAQTQQPSEVNAAQKPNLGSGRAAWMQNPRYAWGVMTHYLADWQARVNNLEISVNQWNKMVDGFDVEAMAKRLESVGAGHYQLSIGQNSGYYLSPNAVYDKFVGIIPSKCSHRDLVADFYEHLHKSDIKLMVYLPSGAPGGDRIAREALEWQNGPYPNKNFQRKWEQVIAEWSKAMGNEGRGLVVRRLLLPELDVSLCRSAKLRELCRRGASRES